MIILVHHLNHCNQYGTLPAFQESVVSISFFLPQRIQKSWNKIIYPSFLGLYLTLIYKLSQTLNCQ